MRLREGPGLRRWLGRTAPRQRPLPEPGTCTGEAVPMALLEPRQLAVVAGRVVGVDAGGRSPSVEADLSDGTGHVALVWMGRRRIVGLEAGVGLVVRGRVARLGDGRLAVYNPTYELRP